MGARGLGLVGTVVLTYYVARNDLGEVADASIVTLLATQFSSIGLGQYLVAKPDAGRDVVWHAVVLHLGLGILALCACLAFMNPLGAWMNAPTLARYLPGLAAAVLLDRVGLVPERLRARDLRFRTIGLERTAGEVTYTFGSVGLAIAGLGGMAVVYANIARSLVKGDDPGCGRTARRLAHPLAYLVGHRSRSSSLRPPALRRRVCGTGGA